MEFKVNFIPSTASTPQITIESKNYQLAADMVQWFMIDYSLEKTSEYVYVSSTGTLTTNFKIK